MIWFFWGQYHLSFLRWVTLLSAVAICPNVILVGRRRPLRPSVAWAGDQDFGVEPAGRNRMADLDRLPVTRVDLEDLALPIARLEAPDVQTADLLAWWILARLGGIVAHMDVVFTRPPPKIEHDIQIAPGEIAFMQGRPCQAWDDIYQRARKSYDPDLYGSCRDGLLEGLGTRLPGDIVSPWGGSQPRPLWASWMFETRTWPALGRGCHGVHWEASRNQKHNQRITNVDQLGDGLVPNAVRRLMRCVG